MLNGGVWAAGLTVVAGDIIVTTTNHCMYVAYVGGTTSSASFTDTTPCPGGTVSDGANVKWRGTRSTATFLYQNTGIAGNTTGTITVSGHPDLMSTITDGANIIWMNNGPAVANPSSSAWTEMGWLSYDSTCGGYPNYFAMGVGTNTYGTAALGYNHYTGGQDSGFMMLEYDCANNRFEQLNTITGIWTQLACGSGNGWTCGLRTQTTVCGGGTCSPSTDLLAVANAGLATIASQVPGFYVSNPTYCPATLHSQRIARSGLYYQLTGTSADINSSCNPIPSNFMVWSTNPAAYDRDLSLQYTFRGFGHSVMTDSHMINWGNATANGTFTTFYSTASPGSPPLMTTWLKPLASQSTPQTVPPGCYVTTGGVIKSPDCNDSEVSTVTCPARAVPVSPADRLPYTWQELYTIMARFGPAFNWLQNMEAVFPIAPGSLLAGYCLQSVKPDCPVSQPATSVGPPWQFTHTFHLGNNTGFSAQFAISQYSQDAKWLFWSGDDGGYFGSNTGVAPAYPCSGTFINCFPFQPVPVRPSMSGEVWQPGYAYVVGNTINPIENTSSGVTGGGDDVYQVIYVGDCGTGSAVARARRLIYWATASPSAARS